MERPHPDRRLNTSELLNLLKDNCPQLSAKIGNTMVSNEVHELVDLLESYERKLEDERSSYEALAAE